MKTALFSSLMTDMPDLFIKLCDAGAACTGMMVFIAIGLILIRKNSSSAK